MSKKNKLAYAAAIMLVVVTGSNMLEANAWTKFEKLRIAPVHKNMYARGHRSPTYKPASILPSYALAQKDSNEKLAMPAGTLSLIQ